MKLIKLTPIAIVTSMMMSNTFAAEAVLNDVIVTAAPMTSPFIVETDPKQPRQPLPAHDGADYLKTIPGFTVMRKGGTDGEPVFRGMGGSRLNILVDDQNVVGGCTFRMDAPTAYIFPEAYDKMTIIKGPQTVDYPNMGSAATVKFEREPKKYDQPSSGGYLSGLIGSFGRHDEIIEVDTGNSGYYLNATGTNSQSGNYKDGSGKEYHSGYHRWSSNAAFGLTPDSNTLVEFSAGKSDGWAKYADRGMDGVKFLRENAALKIVKKNISALVDEATLQISHNKVDHIMDEVTFRSNTSMTDSARLDHQTTQVRSYAKLNLTSNIKLKTGLDLTESNHSKDSGGNNVLTDDSTFKSSGIFAELSNEISLNQRVVSGARYDMWTVDDKRSSSASDTAGQTRKEDVFSGFGRYQYQISKPYTAYVGYGYAERFPDYWELISFTRNMSATASALQSTKKEKTNQLDVGVLYKSVNLNVSLSSFYNKINDFILINYSHAGHGGASPGIASNIDATTYGAEFGVNYQVNNLRTNASIAYVRGTDDTAGQPLPQMPPLEARFGVANDFGKWTHGALVRLVSSQDRYRTNYGNIAGKDLGANGGFAIFSLNTSYKYDKKTKFYAGIDNLFDKQYAEFISRSPSQGMNFPVNPATFRVNEPGRTAWLKATIALD